MIQINLLTILLIFILMLYDRGVISLIQYYVFSLIAIGVIISDIIRYQDDRDIDDIKIS